MDEPSSHVSVYLFFKINCCFVFFVSIFFKIRRLLIGSVIEPRSGYAASGTGRMWDVRPRCESSGETSRKRRCESDSNRQPRALQRDAITATLSERAPLLLIYNRDHVLLRHVTCYYDMPRVSAICYVLL